MMDSSPSSSSSSSKAVLRGEEEYPLTVGLTLIPDLSDGAKTSCNCQHRPGPPARGTLPGK